MSNENLTLIGLDGGATKVSGWVIDVDPQNNSFSLSEYHEELPYSAIDGYLPDFTPVGIQDQLGQRETGYLKLTDNEITQGHTYIEATAQVIRTLAAKTGDRPILIGIGMPGLKTSDGRGINAIANGPRMPEYCQQIEKIITGAGVNLTAPIARLGSDADYCGIGEYYAADGSFKNIRNAYYLGGGTGAADALLLNGNLVPFDEIKSWMAKTWEMKNDQNLSMERYASASGLQFIYSKHSEIPIEEINRKNIYPPQIASSAVHGDPKAISTFEEVAQNLAMLLIERITTLFCGSKNHFRFVNPNRPDLETKHIYRGELLDRIVIGQRLAELMASSDGKKTLTQPLLDHISSIIKSADCLPQSAKDYYLQSDNFRKDILVFSKLREAPALGAGIDAYLILNSEN